MASTIRLKQMNLALPTAGDFQQGRGLETSQRANKNAMSVLDSGEPGIVIAPDAHASPLAQPVPTWVAIAALLVVLKVAAEKAGEKSDFSSIRIGVLNTVIITITAVLGITVGKWIFGYYKIPGVSTLFLGV